MPRNLQTFFLSHGGGPLPLLGDTSHQEMVDCLKTVTTTLRKPSAILVISAHWEAAAPVITASATPELIYDYYGFPDDAYRIQYPCSGEPQLAKEIHRVLVQAGLEATLNGERGLDHGVFVPLRLMYPAADIPCVQLSLVNSLDPNTHIAIGRALQALNYDNLLVIGSGFTFHNMRAFFNVDHEQPDVQNESFENWLLDTLNNTSIDEAEREQRLINWTTAPAARYCHPREEHLLPLHVCYGLMQSVSRQSIELKILNKKTSMYLWGSQVKP